MSVRPHETTRFPLDGFWSNLIFERFFFLSKICRNNSSFIEIRQEYRILYIKTFSHSWRYLAELFLECEIFQIKVVEKIKTYILYSVTFFSRKSCRLWDNVEKCGGAREATIYNTIWRMRVECWMSKATRAHASTHAPTRAHAHRKKCNIYYFSTATMVSRARYSSWYTLPVLLYFEHSVHRVCSKNIWLTSKENFSRTLFCVSLCTRHRDCWPSRVVWSRPYTTMSTNVNCSTHVLRILAVIKLTERVSVKQMSQQDERSLLKKTLRFESPLWAADKGTNTQAWQIREINGDNL